MNGIETTATRNTIRVEKRGRYLIISTAEENWENLVNFSYRLSDRGYVISSLYNNQYNNQFAVKVEKPVRLFG